MAELGVTTRAYVPEDRMAVMGLWEKHHEKFGTIPPDPDYPNHILTTVVEKDGKIVAAGTGRLTGELFLVQDPDWGSPKERWDTIVELLGFAKALTKNAGLGEAHIFVPQGLKRYVERLKTVPGVFFDDRLHLILFTEGREIEEAPHGCRREYSKH